MGIVYFVGAGPGDAELITLKGIEKLKKCDVVIYDRLISDELLKYVKESCEKIYVGKEAGKHYKKQSEINEILVKKALDKNVVVRLKGGDSFVFGRGGEEIEELNKYNIPYEMVPGVTSAIAVPECAGIPVTHRGVSRSFHVITGHTDGTNGDACDYKALSYIGGTIVFLMGLSNLKQIVNNLVEAGMSYDTPVAVISEGTCISQNTVQGTLKNITDKVRKAGINPPAIIVIGETASYKYIYNENKYQSTVGIVATKAIYDKLNRGLLQKEIKGLHICDMDIKKTEQIEKLDKELEFIEKYNWVLFTSRNGVIIFFEEIKKLNIDIRRLAVLKFAVIGSGTASELKKYGINADFLPSKYNTKVMAEEFLGIVKKEDWLLIPRAVKGSIELTEPFLKNEIAFKDIHVYDVEGHLTSYIEILDRLDFIVFVSASGVEAFFREIKDNNIVFPERIKTVCIGEITQKTLVKEYKEADIVASVSNIEGVIKAIEQSGWCSQ